MNPAFRLDLSLGRAWRRHRAARSSMSLRRISWVGFALLSLASLPGWSAEKPRSQGWPQWGQNPQHTGTENVSVQPLRRRLDDVIYDPFVEAEKADPLFGDGDLSVH